MASEEKGAEGEEDVQVPVYLLKNGFYAKSEDIFRHPNVAKQLRQINAKLTGVPSGKEVADSDE